MNALASLSKHFSKESLSWVSALSSDRVVFVGLATPILPSRIPVWQCWSNRPRVENISGSALVGRRLGLHLFLAGRVVPLPSAVGLLFVGCPSATRS